MKVDSDFFGKVKLQRFFGSLTLNFGKMIQFDKLVLKWVDKKSIDLAIMKCIMYKVNVARMKLRKLHGTPRSKHQFPVSVYICLKIKRTSAYWTPNEVVKDDTFFFATSTTWRQTKKTRSRNFWNWIWTQNWLFFVHSIAVRKYPRSAKVGAGWKPKIRKFQVGRLTVLLGGWNLCLRTNMPNCQGGVCFAS